MNPHILQAVNQHPRQLVRQIRKRLNGNGLSENWGVQTSLGSVKGSAVLLLLTHRRIPGDKGAGEPYLLFNKRSDKVLQPGDLCYPGGGVERLDKVLSPAMHWPLSPLRKWPSWRKWKATDHQKATALALLLTTALREGWEEMRLNPFRVTFMGPLPIQKLIMFDRQIYPLAGFLPANQKLVANWEVERIVYIPLLRLLEPRHYGRYRLNFKTGDGQNRQRQDFPCYIHPGRNGREILWGATFRITMDFLKLAFGFDLPDLSDATVIRGNLNDAYYKGTTISHPKP